MTASPEVLRVARRWTSKADEDIAAAERLLALDDSLAAVACFHSQQAVEKLIKALLVLAGVPFPRTHDLIQLSGLVPAELALGDRAERCPRRRVHLGWTSAQRRYVGAAFVGPG